MAGVCFNESFTEHCIFFDSQIMHIHNTCTVRALGQAAALLLLKVRLTLFRRALLCKPRARNLVKQHQQPQRRTHACTRTHTRACPR